MAVASASFSPLASLLNKPSEWSNDVRVSAAIVALSVILFSVVLLRPSFDGKVYDLGGIPVLTVWSFFTKRYDFIREHFKNSGGKTFRFKVLQVRDNIPRPNDFSSHPYIMCVKIYSIESSRCPESNLAKSTSTSPVST